MESSESGTTNGRNGLDQTTIQHLMDARRHQGQIIKQAYMSLKAIEDALNLPPEKRIKIN